MSGEPQMSAQPQAPKRQKSDEPLHQKQREDGHHAVKQRYAHIRRGLACKVGDQQRHDEVEGLKIADLPLAREADDEKNQKIEYDDPNKENQHAPSLEACYFTDSVCRHAKKY
ncbi:MAG: hypothetical protein Q4E65_04705 [Clostridia bacterium]|nr:hypothetical protein [Clostridia bacterium]